jgi:hypothetical protein
VVKGVDVADVFADADIVAAFVAVVAVADADVVAAFVDVVVVFADTDVVAAFVGVVVVFADADVVTAFVDVVVVFADADVVTAFVGVVDLFADADNVATAVDDRLNTERVSVACCVIVSVTETETCDAVTVRETSGLCDGIADTVTEPVELCDGSADPDTVTDPLGLFVPILGVAVSVDLGGGVVGAIVRVTE